MKIKAKGEYGEVEIDCQRFEYPSQLESVVKAFKEIYKELRDKESKDDIRKNDTTI